MSGTDSLSDDDSSVQVIDKKGTDSLSDDDSSVQILLIDSERPDKSPDKTQQQQENTYPPSSKMTSTGVRVIQSEGSADCEPTAFSESETTNRPDQSSIMCSDSKDRTENKLPGPTEIVIDKKGTDSLSDDDSSVQILLIDSERPDKSPDKTQQQQENTYPPSSKMTSTGVRVIQSEGSADCEPTAFSESETTNRPDQSSIMCSDSKDRTENKLPGPTEIVIDKKGTDSLSDDDSSVQILLIDSERPDKSPDKTQQQQENTYPPSSKMTSTGVRVIQSEGSADCEPTTFSESETTNRPDQSSIMCSDSIDRTENKLPGPTEITLPRSLEGVIQGSGDADPASLETQDTASLASASFTDKSENNLSRSSEKESDVRPGTLVWARLTKKGKYYLGMTLPHMPNLVFGNQIGVYWLKEKTLSSVSKHQMSPMALLDYSNQKKLLSMDGVKIATEILAFQCGFQNDHINDLPRNIYEFLEWINKFKDKFVMCNHQIPEYILKEIQNINNILSPSPLLASSDEQRITEEVNISRSLILSTSFERKRELTEPDPSSFTPRSRFTLPNSPSTWSGTDSLSDDDSVQTLPRSTEGLIQGSGTTPPTGTSGSDSNSTPETQDNTSLVSAGCTDISENNLTGSSEMESYVLPGTVVWARLTKRGQYYLGMTLPDEIMPYKGRGNKVGLYWLQQQNVSFVYKHQMEPMVSYDYSNQKKILCLNGILIAIEILAIQCEFQNDPINDQPTNISEIVNWIDKYKEQLVMCNYEIPEYILLITQNIFAEYPSNSFLRSSDEYSITGDLGGSSIPLPSFGRKRKLTEPDSPTLTKKRRFTVPYEDRNVEELCIGCRTAKKKKSDHPLFTGFLCDYCVERVTGNLVTAVSSTGNHKFCCACGWRHSLIHCKSCPWMFCVDCIEFWFETDYSQDVIIKCSWTCLMCEQQIETTGMYEGLLELRADFLNEFYNSPIQKEVESPNAEPKQRIRVLSLFDGISTGLVVLKKLGFEVDAYFASEIDEDAINVSKRNHGNDVTHIGDVRHITNNSLQTYLPIHLIIGGSPCNDLSCANYGRKGLKDMSGTGPLFFEFHRVLSLLKNTQEHVFFLFENVASMEKEHQDTITRFFEVDPVTNDAITNSAMRRQRLYWGNIPGLQNLNSRILRRILERSDKTNNVVFQDFLTENLGRQAIVDKIRTVTTNTNSLNQGNGLAQVTMNGKDSIICITELEKVFGFREHYTDVLSLTPRSRQRLIGKSWSVPVIKEIFWPLTVTFLLDEKHREPQEKKEHSKTLLPTNLVFH